VRGYRGVTLAEVRFRIELLSDAARRSELNDWLSRKVRPMFEQRVLEITEDVIPTAHTVPPESVFPLHDW
jgi:hypothetical protein